MNKVIVRTCKSCIHRFNCELLDEDYETRFLCCSLLRTAVYGSRICTDAGVCYSILINGKVVIIPEQPEKWRQRLMEFINLKN